MYEFSMMAGICSQVFSYVHKYMDAEHAEQALHTAGRKVLNQPCICDGVWFE